MPYKERMQNLIELTKNDLEAFVAEDLKEPRFRAEQIWQWLWQKRVRDIDAMTNLSKPLREKVAGMANIAWPEIAQVAQSKDGTIKFLLRLHDGKLIETVLIPMQDRYSQCLSTQVGCAMACTFCNTGKLGFERNLTYGEIMGQILVGRQYLEDKGMDPLKNLVFMGMGEPLLNLDNLIKVLTDLPCERGLRSPGGVPWCPRSAFPTSSRFWATSKSPCLPSPCTLPPRSCAPRSCPRPPRSIWTTSWPHSKGIPCVRASGSPSSTCCSRM